MAASSAHPALRGEAWPMPDTDLAASPPPTWTPDMDDMLRLILRHRAFRFDEAAPRLREYITRVRSAGGILPDSVLPPRYDEPACRHRYAQLDLAECKRRDAPRGGGAAVASAASPVAVTPHAIEAAALSATAATATATAFSARAAPIPATMDAPLVASISGRDASISVTAGSISGAAGSIPVSARSGSGGACSISSDEDEYDDMGVLDASALRQRLMGLPPSPATSAHSARATGPPPVSPHSNPAGGAPPSGIAAAGPPPVSPPATAAGGGSDTGGGVAAQGGGDTGGVPAVPEAILLPMLDARSRLEGLQARLTGFSGDAQDMSVKFDELRALAGELSVLQQRGLAWQAAASPRPSQPGANGYAAGRPLPGAHTAGGTGDGEDTAGGPGDGKDTAGGEDRLLPMDVVDAIDLEDLLRSLGNTGEGGEALYLSDTEVGDAVHRLDTQGGLGHSIRSLGNTGEGGGAPVLTDIGGVALHGRVGDEGAGADTAGEGWCGLTPPPRPRDAWA